MKKIIRFVFISIGVLLIGLFGLRYWTQSHSPFERVEAQKEKLKVEVGYCRPLMKERKIFGELIPFNIVWRTGANEATQISFSKTCTFGGRKIKKGAYSLWTIPGEKIWTIILNNETGQWGTNYDPSKDYLRFRVFSEKKQLPVEQLTIQLLKQADAIDFILEWENTRLNIPIR
jgi:Protein of unknown function (DUF2911)